MNEMCHGVMSGWLLMWRPTQVSQYSPNKPHCLLLEGTLQGEQKEEAVTALDSIESEDC